MVNHSMSFIFKKIISQFLMPEPFCILLLLIGLIFLWFSKFQKTGKIIATTGLCLLIIFSYKITVTLISSPLEYAHSNINKSNQKNYKDIKYIVVLGGGIKCNTSHPITSQIGESSLSRLSEGIRLLNIYPEAKLILSGGKTFSRVSEASIMKQVAEILGVSKEKIITDKISLDTEQQAKFIKKIIADKKFIIVTSALHMPRSIFLFKKYGMNPIAAPTAYNSNLDENSPYYYLPSSSFLSESTSAVHEYIGFLWLYVKNLFI